MNIQQLHILTTALKDTEQEIASISRKLGTMEEDTRPTGEVIIVKKIATSNIDILSDSLNLFKSGEDGNVDYTLFNLQDTWSATEKFVEDDSEVEYLVIKAFKLFTTEQNESVREVLINKRIDKIALSKEYQLQIKALVNEDDLVLEDPVEELPVDEVVDEEVVVP